MNMKAHQKDQEVRQLCKYLLRGALYPTRSILYSKMPVTDGKIQTVFFMIILEIDVGVFEDLPLAEDRRLFTSSN